MSEIYKIYNLGKFFPNYNFLKMKICLYFSQFESAKYESDRF